METNSFHLLNIFLNRIFIYLFYQIYLLTLAFRLELFVYLFVN